MTDFNWIPVKGVWHGNRKEFEGKMPENGQNVLVSYKYRTAGGGTGYKVIHTKCIYSEAFGYRFADVAVDYVNAWMPCPEPYIEKE